MIDASFFLVDIIEWIDQVPSSFYIHSAKTMKRKRWMKVPLKIILAYVEYALAQNFESVGGFLPDIPSA